MPASGSTPHRKSPDCHRNRRRGVFGGPGGHRRRHRSPAQGRQRRGCGRGHRGGTGRHRTLQRWHWRWRILPLLRCTIGKVSTIDGRETAPAGIAKDAFIDPETGKPYNFTPELVTSGVAVGVPGTLATWQRALDNWGSQNLKQVLRPATKIASRGFAIDETFREQTLDNKERFAAFPATSELFCSAGMLSCVGTIFRNPDLADTYRMLAKQGLDGFYAETWLPRSPTRQAGTAKERRYRPPGSRGAVVHRRSGRLRSG